MAMVARSTSHLTGLIITLTLIWGCSHQPNHPFVKQEPQDYTQLLSQNLTNQEARKVVIEHSIAQLGKPYKLSGNSPNEGFDCSGLVFYTHLTAGKLVPRRAEEQYTSVKPATRILPGDLVFFSTDSKGKRVDHVGIYIGQNKFIHAPGKGKAVSTAKITDDYWQKRLVGAGTYWD